MTANDRENEHSPLSARQEAFIAALLSSPSLRAAAKIANIGEKTARRWMQEPHVKRAYQEAQKEVFASGLDSLKSAVALAVTTLTNHLTDDETPAAVRVRAAEIILRQSHRGT